MSNRRWIGDGKIRCGWCGDNPLYVLYHDHEWGVPVYDDRRLFEMLVLEGAQAGLSWLTILKKRGSYRKAFDGFSIEQVAGYGETEVRRLLADPGIVRNRLKIEGAVKNARGVRAIQSEFGSLASFIWGYVDRAPLQNGWTSLAEVPARTEISDRMSRDLKKRGFSFVGPTVCYAFMQAVGLVNDHMVGCFRYEAVKQMDGKKKSLGL